MPQVLVYLLSLALTFTALALARQIRLRRALEQLLRRIFTHWRARDPHEHARPDEVHDSLANDRRVR